jgi:hypothetical protein
MRNLKISMKQWRKRTPPQKESAVMRLLSIFWEVWCDLPRTRKFMVCAGVVLCALGLPRSELGLVWYEARILFGLENCGEDSTTPLMAALKRSDFDAIEKAVDPNHERKLAECGLKTLQHPKGTIALLLDERGRMELGNSAGND